MTMTGRVHRPAAILAATLAVSIVFFGSLAPAQAQGPHGAGCLRERLSVYEKSIVPVASKERRGTDEMTPPADPDVGDSWLWYTWLLGGFPVAEEKMCTVRGRSENVYVVVENSQWLTNVDQNDVDTILERFENSSIGPYPSQGIWDLNTSHFGDPPDELDNDPRIYILYYDFDVSSDGFFWFFDEYPDGTQQFASNECEVVYMNCSDNDPGGDYLIAVAAHEFHHLIHWNYDTNESTWVNEGLAELAMWLYGRPDNIVGFPSLPDNNLTEWTSGFSDYIKTYLWTLYFFEHYGGQAAVLDVTHQPANGIVGYDATLNALAYDEDFVDVFSDWVVANFVDDETFLDGRFGYAGEDLPTFSSVQQGSYPVGPVAAVVKHYAADYVKFINGEPQELQFDGTNTSAFTARAVTYQAGAAQDLIDMSLDANQDGAINLGGFGSDYDQVVFVIANIAPGAGSVSYSYLTEAPAAAGDPARPAVLAWLSPEPHPLAPGGRLALRLPDDGAAARLELFDVLGRRVWDWRGGPSRGDAVIPWDGRGAGGEKLASGVYLARLSSGRDRMTARLVLID